MRYAPNMSRRRSDAPAPSKRRSPEDGTRSREAATSDATVASAVAAVFPVDLADTTQVTGRLAFSNLAMGVALSVLGVTGNASADVASIAAASDHQVMRRSGASVAFGAVNLASANAVTGDLPFANIVQASAASKLVGRGAAVGAGDFEEITLGAGLSMAGTTLSVAGTVGVNALLDGANHTDTLAGAVVRGDLIIGNSTPKWARLGVGAANSVLTANGNDPAWSTTPTVAALTTTGAATIGGTLTMNGATIAMNPLGNVNVTGAAGIVNGLTFGTNILTVNFADNRIGIGTAAPATTLEVAGTVQIASGAVGALALASRTDTDTGLYFSGGDVLNLVTGGAARLSIGSNGALTSTSSGGADTWGFNSTAANGGSIAIKTNGNRAGGFGSAIALLGLGTNTDAAFFSDNSLYFTPASGAGTVVYTIVHSSVGFNPQNDNTLPLGTAAKQWTDVQARKVSVGVGAVGTPSLTTSTDTNTGFYFDGADGVLLATGGTLRLTINTAAMIATLPLQLPLGAAATPALTSSGDPNTGFYFDGSDNIYITTGGIARYVFGGAGGDSGMPAAAKIYLDGTAFAGDTYIRESSANVIGLIAGGVEGFQQSQFSTRLMAGLVLGGEISPSFTGTQAAWNPTGFASANVVRVTGTSTPVINGLSATVNNHAFLLINIGATSITINNESASASSAGNRIRTSTAAAVTFAQHRMAWVWHDATADRWRLAMI